MRNKLAVLIALANCVEGRATLDKLGDDVSRLIAKSVEDITPPDQFSALDHIDLFEAGLVVGEGDSLRITENGWSLLLALGVSPHEPPTADSAMALQTLKPIDDPVGGYVSNETSAISGGAELGSDAPTLLIRKFGSMASDALSRSNPLSKLRAKMKRGINAWRRHIQRDQTPQQTPSSGRNVERGLLAAVSLLVVISCAGAVGALMQVKSLKSQLAVLQRELPALKERITKLDQIETGKEASEKLSHQRNQTSRQAGSQQAPLALSREEIQLIRDYIKPAPAADTSMAPINIGDLINGPTIPFPSPVTEKVPKLLGTRFAIRNGAIIIVRKDGGQAEAVLGPN